MEEEDDETTWQIELEGLSWEPAVANNKISGCWEVKGTMGLEMTTPDGVTFGEELKVSEVRPL